MTIEQVQPNVIRTPTRALENDSPPQFVFADYINHFLGNLIGFLRNDTNLVVRAGLEPETPDGIPNNRDNLHSD